MTREPFISARAAARFVGFEPGEGIARDDREMHRFYEWVRTMRIPKHHRGPRQLVFRVSELEAAIDRQTPAPASGLEASPVAESRMGRLAQDFVLRAVTGGKGR